MIVFPWWSTSYRIVSYQSIYIRDAVERLSFLSLWSHCCPACCTLTSSPFHHVCVMSMPQRMQWQNRSPYLLYADRYRGRQRSHHLILSYPALPSFTTCESNASAIVITTYCLQDQIILYHIISDENDQSSRRIRHRTTASTVFSFADFL